MNGIAASLIFKLLSLARAIPHFETVFDGFNQ